MGRHRCPVLPLRIADSHCARLVHCRLRPRYLPPQPLPRLHLPQIRPLARARHGHGRRRARRSRLSTAHKERPGVQTIRAETARVQVLALGHPRHCPGFPVQLERDLQLACLLARVGGVLVDSGVFDYEEADSEYDQVQVRPLGLRQGEIRRFQMSDSIPVVYAIHLLVLSSYAWAGQSERLMLKVQRQHTCIPPVLLTTI